MKKVITVSFGILISLLSRATIHVVQVSNFQFSPANVSDVSVGDTMRWVWVTGSFNHTTTCNPVTQGTGNSLPDGANTWDSPLNSGSLSFDYKVTTAGIYHYWCKPHAPNMAASFTASNILPIKLSALQAFAADGNVTLKWTTQSEENTSYFSIRRSANGSVFSEIAKVPAAGNSSAEKAYTFTDTKASAGQKYYYYNLAIVDKDGRQAFSDTKLFKNNEAITKLILSLSPNPITRPGHLMLTFNAEKEGKMDVRVINSDGKSLINTTMQAYAGVNNGHLHLGELASGTYTIIFTLNGTNEIHQVIYK